MEGIKTSGETQIQSSIESVSSDLGDSLRDINEKAEEIQQLPQEQKGKAAKRLLREIESKVNGANATLIQIDANQVAQLEVTKKIARNGKVTIAMLLILLLLLAATLALTALK